MEAFDNTSYESRTAAEWMEIGIQEDSTTEETSVCVPALALKLQDDQTGTWVECRVTFYDEARWSLTLINPTRQSTQLPPLSSFQCILLSPTSIYLQKHLSRA